MKHVFTKSLLLVAAVVSFSSCDKGGGGGGGQQANVPTVPGPQGNIYAQNDQNTYCSFTNGSLICYSRNFQGNQCATNTLTYTDIPTMCNQLNQLQSLGLGNQCNVSLAVMQAYNQYCLNQNNGGTVVNPSAPNITGAHVVCEFEAYRSSQGRWFRRESRTPKLTAYLGLVNTTSAASVDLRNKFLGFDIGSFGRTTMSYKPAGIKGTADTITITNQGLDGSMSLSQSGFAGQAVSMDVMSDDGNMKLTVSCSGQGATFRKNVAAKAFTQYVCRGKASLYGSRLENIEAVFPYNASLLNSELNLAENLTATVTGDSGSDNARITFTASGIGSGVSLQSSSYLKTNTELMGTDGYTTLNLKCGPQ
jgi:hypothetical protein